jgi:hypothetical protein
MPGDFSIAVADMDQYTLMFANVSLSKGAGQSGYADGEFFTAKQLKPSFTFVEGTDGSVARSKTNSRMIEMTLSFLQTSANNSYLSTLLQADENTPGGIGIGSFVLKDLQGTTLIACTRCWITTPADVNLNRGAEPRKWMLHGIKSVYLVGNN